MFTVKFYRTTRQVSVSCPVYEVQTFDNGGYAVIVHKSPILGQGVEYQIRPTDHGDSSNNFESCFVENEAGKTIATFRASDGAETLTAARQRLTTT